MKGRTIENERQKGGTSSLYRGTPQMPAKARVELGQIQEEETMWSPECAAATQVLGPPFALPEVHQEETGPETEGPGLKLSL